MLVKLVQLVVELAHLKHLGVQLAIAPWSHIVLVKCLNFTLQTPHTIRGVPATIPSNLGQGESGGGSFLAPKSERKLKVRHWPQK